MSQALSKSTEVDARPQRTFGRGRIATKAGQSRTRLDTLYQNGAARIRIPDHPGQTGLEAIIINTAGGLTGGDDVAWQARAGAHTHLTVTTQACEKVYKADASTAHVDVALTVEEGAMLHWLPQETILFDQARLARTIIADLAEQATLLLVEPVIFGRKAMNEQVETGLWHDSWRIHHKGALIHGENVRLKDDIAQQLNSLASLDGMTALATLALLGNHAEAKLAGARDLLGSVPGCIGGASCWDIAGVSKLLVRVAAPDGYTLRQLLTPLINHLASKPGEPVTLPKIWSL